MAETLDTLILQVRADTRAFASDVQTLRGSLENSLAVGAEVAGRRMEAALDRFIRTGKFGFEDLKRLGLSVLSDIASAQLRSAFGQTGGGSGNGGLFSTLLSTVFSAFSSSSGLPGRATGGPVTGGRAYVVGERGPEVFVPQGAGRIETAGSLRSGQRPVAISIHVAAPEMASPQLMQRSANQVARAVRRALIQADG